MGTPRVISKSRPYRIWSSMKARCFNEKATSFPRYGAKGVTVCDEWKSSFQTFWNDMKDSYFDCASIDRIDNSKGYSKENCRWATAKEQGSNKNTVKMYTHKGRTMHASDWEIHLGLKHGTVRARIRKGWQIDKALMKKEKSLGYFFDKKRSDKPYRVQIKRNKVLHFIGRFKTEREAIIARKTFLASYLLTNGE